MLDFNTKMLKRQPENLIIIPEYKGEADDRELYNLIPFLESTVQTKVELASPLVTDVRTEIAKYGSDGGYNKYFRELLETKVKLEDQRVFCA